MWALERMTWEELDGSADRTAFLQETPHPSHKQGLLAGKGHRQFKPKQFLSAFSPRGVWVSSTWTLSPCSGCDKELERESLCQCSWKEISALWFAICKVPDQINTVMISSLESWPETAIERCLLLLSFCWPLLIFPCGAWWHCHSLTSQENGVSGILQNSLDGPKITVL